MLIAWTGEGGGWCGRWKLLHISWLFAVGAGAACGVHTGWVLKPSTATAVLYYLGNFPDVFPSSFDLAALVFPAFSLWLRLMVQIDWW
jgi:hypothetical protein